MSKVTFDYSRTAGVVRESEMESMKAIAESARELLLSRKGAGNDFLGGLICRWIMTKRSSRVF